MSDAENEEIVVVEEVESENEDREVVSLNLIATGLSNFATTAGTFI